MTTLSAIQAPMLASLHPPFAREDGGHGLRVMRALGLRRLAAAAVVALFLSFGPLLSSEVLDFLSPAEIVVAWFEHFVELAAVAAALVAVYTLLDELLPVRMRFRLAVVCLALLGASSVLAILLYAYYAQGFEHLPALARLAADSLRWGLPAVFLALIADAHRRALQAGSVASAEELMRAQLRQGESEQRLALLQAQLEPHFLFNMLGNVRRLYRTRPQAGCEAVDSLARYLRVALPQVRSGTGTLGREIDLVRSYLELFQVRMGVRLVFAIEVDAALHVAEFPPMLLMTLVENAVRHGIEPVGGGHVWIRARGLEGTLEVAVLDDGAGFGAAASSGTGVGLVNVRRQLAARYPGKASLTLQQREPRGAIATLAIPWRVAPESSPAPAPPAPAPPAPAPTLDHRVASRSNEPIVPPSGRWTSPRKWPLLNRGAIVMASLISISVPITFLAGDLGVMRDAGAADVMVLVLWFALYGVELWILLLAMAVAIRRLGPSAGTWVRDVAGFLAACGVAAFTTLSTAPRARILVEQGVVRSATTMHVYAFVFALAMALLYLVHLRRGMTHEAAAARLAAAQAAQRDARHGMMLARLHALQARIDPQFLFEMLGTVRRSYEVDAAGAERLLDELIQFLRSALPRLQSPSSSILREAGLARAYARLRMLAGAADASVTVALSTEAMHARLQPGILLPLIHDALRERSGPCRLTAHCVDGDCDVVMALPARPSDAVLEQVRTLLANVYDTRAALKVEETADAVIVTTRVPYEPT
jgi:LytS/YehU family sensor histidine kinase